MKVVGIIPARWASTRFPGKSLAMLCGKPLIQWVLERSRLSKRLDALFVATDDNRIRDAVEAAGGEAIMTRSDHCSGTDRVAEAVGILGRNFDAIINIQGDEPLIDPCLIDELVEVIMMESSWDMVTAASPLVDDPDIENPAVCKVVFNADGGALYFSRAPIPRIRDADFKADQPVYWRHIGIYLYKTRFLAGMVAEQPSLLERAERLEQLRALHIGGRIRVVRTSASGPGVDLPDDIRQAEIEIKRLGLI